MTDARNEFPTGVEGYTLRVDSSDSFDVMFRGSEIGFIFVTDDEDERDLVAEVMKVIEQHQRIRDFASNFTEIA